MQDPSSRSHFQQYMQPPWKAIHSMSMYCWLYKDLKPNLVFISGICWKCMHFLEVNNKLINGKSNREPGMEGAGEKSGLGFRFMFSSSTSLTLFSRIFLSEGQFNFYKCKMIVKTAFICITIIIKIASIKKIIDYHFKFRGSKTIQFLKTGPIRKQGVWL